MTKLSVTEVADFLGGSIEGKPREYFMGISKIDQGLPGSLTFLANVKYVDHLQTTSADVILINREQEVDSSSDKTFIRTDDPYLGFCQVLNRYFNPAVSKSGIHPSATVSETASIGKDVYLGPNVVIDDHVTVGDGTKIYPNSYVGAGSTLGNNCIIYSNVSIYYDSRIGDEVIIHSGTVIGSDGFGHAPQKDGSYIKIPQIGNVIIGSKVEIGSNCSIDRATLGSTRIGDGCRLDNLIQVAHNVEIGAHTVIAGQSGISGSTTLGERCVIGGQVGFAGHLKVASGTQVGAQSGLNRDIEEENTQWFGSPVMPLKDALRTILIIQNLPEMRSKIKQLERTTEKIKQSLEQNENTQDER
ncbi:MAG: UDP-3-O-(3-hydroxymyristoyl)glucosamine N-acyltransferase [Bacteroidetes bacterium]|nr:UDP-3-O-(3-hydroxymyristoyl)glucosamine N-acyltransferase [Bacteroidota bacterium]